MIPLFAWILMVTTGFHMIILNEVVLLGVTFWILKILGKGTYGNKRKAAALMFGINVASIFWLMAMFPRFADGHASTTFQVLTYGAAFLILVFLYLSSVTDSGTVFTTYREKLHVRT